MAETTTIEVSRENWQGLNSRKRPGDSFDDVITRLLETGSDQEEPAGDEIEAECDKCGHSWGYGGSRDPGQWVTCPQCKSSIKL